jgi:asparagine synthase (glutamine-hydrolysing)
MMGHSVEGRVPFLDHRLIELAAQIPPKFKLRGLEEKYILKRAFDDILPSAIARRPKQPYRAPIAACFARGNDNLGAALLHEDALQRTGFANPAAVTNLLKKNVDNPAPSERDEMAIAAVTSLQLLHHHFVAEFPVTRIEACA